MKRVTGLLLCCCLLPGCGGEPPAPVVSSSTKLAPEPVVDLGDFKVIKDAHIQIRQLPEYEPFGQGFLNLKSQGQIDIQFSPGSFEKAKTELITPGVFNKLLSSETLPPKGELARHFFVHDQSNGAKPQIVRWTVLIGNDSWTTQVRGLIPPSLVPTLGVKLKAMLLSAEGIPGDTRPVDSVQGYHLLSSTLLKPTLVSTPWVQYSPAQAFAGTPGDIPLLNFHPAVNFVLDSDRDAAPKSHLTWTGARDIVVVSSKPIELVGLKGLEIEATARHSKVDRNLSIYQVILFGPKTFVRISGQVGDDAKEQYLPEFRRMAQGIVKE